MKKWVPLVLLGLLAAEQVFGAGYNREAFKHWSDLDHDGMNTRYETLASQAVPCPSTVLVVLSATCKAWVCPYTGTVFFEPGKLDIDHIVPLKWAWEHGADKWSPGQREAFANDPKNLLAVEASANREKGAKGPDEWLPPKKDYDAEYIDRFGSVCDNYKLVYDKKKLSRLRLMKSAP